MPQYTEFFRSDTVKRCTQLGPEEELVVGLKSDVEATLSGVEVDIGELTVERNGMIPIARAC